MFVLEGGTDPDAIYVMFDLEGGTGPDAIYVIFVLEGGLTLMLYMLCLI